MKHFFSLILFIGIIACNKEASSLQNECRTNHNVPSVWQEKTWNFAHSPLGQLYDGDCLDTICPTTLFELNEVGEYTLEYTIPYYKADSTLLVLERSETGTLTGTECSITGGLGFYTGGSLNMEPLNDSPYTIKYTFGGIGNQLIGFRHNDITLTLYVKGD